MSRDWSESGVFLRTSQPLAVGARCRMHVHLGRPPKRIAISGIVSRVAADPLRGNKLVGMGISFQEVPNEILALVRPQGVKPVPKLFDSTPPPAKKPDLEFPREAQHRQEVVVVGEDSPERSLLVRTLTRQGWGTTVASRAAELVNLLKANREPIALVIFDDTGEVLRAVEMQAIRWSPNGSIVVGAPPKLSAAIAFPVIVLPKKWNLALIPTLLAQLAPPELDLDLREYSADMPNEPNEIVFNDSGRRQYRG